MVPDRMDSCPPPGPELNVIRLKAMQTFSGVSLGTRIRGYRTHWDKGAKQTIPCFQPHIDCDGHRRNLPQRWKGYLHVERHRRLDDRRVEKEEGFLELTPVAAMDLRNGLGHIADLRGIPFTLTRLNGDKAHLRVAVFLDHVVAVSELPPERSPYETLMRIWGFLDFPPESDQRDMFG
jgi:hypothetical protein